jgi:hypothetical protein
MSLKNSNDTNGNRTSDLPVCSEVNYYMYMSEMTESEDEAILVYATYVYGRLDIVNRGWVDPRANPNTLKERQMSCIPTGN